MSDEDPGDEEIILVPEITAQDLAGWLRERGDFFVLDVREPYEFSRVKLDHPRVVYAPLSELARKFLDALPEQAKDKSVPLVVMCHHGNRSAQVTAWLKSLGWKDVHNLAGGIDAYARQVDPKVGFY